MQEPIIPLGRVNKNGHMYTKDSFEDLPQSVPVYLGYEENAPLAGEANNIQMDEAGTLISADIRLFNGSLFDKLTEEQVHKGFRFTSSGIGTLEGEKVTKYSLTGVHIIPAQDSSWE